MPLSPVQWPRSMAVAMAAVVWVAGAAGCRTAPAVAGQATGGQGAAELIGAAPGNTGVDQHRRKAALWYQIEVGPERLVIHVRLLEPPERTVFFLPGQWADRSDYADDIRILGATGPNGARPLAIDRTQGRIDIQSPDNQSPDNQSPDNQSPDNQSPDNQSPDNQSPDNGWVQLDYAVDLAGPPEGMRRFHPRFVDDVLFAYGPAVLVLPSEQICRQLRDIPIEVHAPADWAVLATWPHVQTSTSNAADESRVHGFVATTPAALRDAFIAAGADIDVHRSAGAAGASALTVGFGPGLRIDQKPFRRHIDRLIGGFRRRFGDLGDVTAYMRAVANAHSERRGVGQRGGFVVEIPPAQPLNDRALLLLAHEAFHLWNGHYLSPAPDAEPQTRWFKEGVTHYMALKMLARLGLFSRHDVLAELARSASYYGRNPAASGATAGRTDRARLPYDRGVLLAVGLDALLTRASRGRQGIGQWIGRLIDHLGGRGRLYHLQDLRAALVAVAGSAQSPALGFWDAYAAQPRRLDPAAIFDHAGLHWLDADDDVDDRLLTVDRPGSPFETMFPRRQSTLAAPTRTGP